MSTVDNGIYDTFGERWYEAQDHPLALLRAESRLLSSWVARETQRLFPMRAVRLLDLGCGAGFLANSMAQQGHKLVGLDASESSLVVARRHDATGRVRYVHGDARSLPFPDASFDVVTAMDFLEHVEEPDAVMSEVGRILTPGGRFFFHTFNRNWLSWLVVIKGVEWFVRNTPERMHVLRYFLKPAEVRSLCAAHGLSLDTLHGVTPVVRSRSFLRLLLSGKVPADFAFRFTRPTWIAYAGSAQRQP